MPTKIDVGSDKNVKMRVWGGGLHPIRHHIGHFLRNSSALSVIAPALPITDTDLPVTAQAPPDTDQAPISTVTV